MTKTEITNVLEDNRDVIFEKVKNREKVRDIAESLGIRTQTLYGFLSRNKIYLGRMILSDDEQKSFIEDYESGKRFRWLSVKYNISYASARNYAVKYNNLKKHAQYRKKSINENFFDTFTEESLWVLGWMFSDGNVSKKSNSFSVTVHKNDLEVLLKIKEVMGVKEDSIYTPSDRNAVAFYSSHPRIKNRLCELGRIPNKSLVIKYPTYFTEDWQHWAFLRGVMEGDGHIGIKDKTANRPSFIFEIASGSVEFV